MRETKASPRGLTRAGFLALAVGALGAGAAATVRGISTYAAEGAPIIRRIPTSGEALPVVGLGTAPSFGAARSDAELDARQAVIEALLAGGGTVIETSPGYGDAEEAIGRALARLGRRNEAFIATRASVFGPDEGAEQYAQSFRKLRTGRIDLLLIDNLRDMARHGGTVRQLRTDGEIRYVGATHSGDSEHDKLVALIKAREVEFVRLDYSIDARAAEKTVLPAARDDGVAVMIGAPFGHGLLFRAVRGKEPPAWAADFGAKSWAQFFLKYVLAEEAVTVAVPVATSVQQMVDNLGAARGRLPDAAERRRMVALIESL